MARLNREDLQLSMKIMFTKNFSQLTKKDVGIAGGKGASLGEMTGAGIPVPPGFVVLASAFDRFLGETDIDVEIEAVLHKLKHQDINSVELASEKIRSLILSAKMPKDLQGLFIKEFKVLKAPLVAVRSSATAEDSSTTSWAGELESYLNTSKANLLENIKKCWASLFTPRAIFYRFEKKLHKSKISVAVVVQKMIQSEISGIAFTVHPVTKDYDQMVIEAGYGLGEAIVGGMITPDTYVIKKLKAQNSKRKTADEFEILDINVSEQNMMIVKSGKSNIQKSISKVKGSKQKISGSLILKLAKLCAKIETHYKKPQDIEWALEKGNFYIVQSRPITTL